jgi:hypothetical protein
MSDMIDNFAPDGGVADVTGGKISFIMRYAEIGASDATEHTDIGQLDPKLALFELVPLSDQFDALWQGKPGIDGKPSVDANGKSQRDLAIATIRKAITDAASSAFAFTNDLPLTGTLRCFAAEQHLFLSYKLPNCKVTFSIPIVLGIDATVDITFDIEMLIILGFQDWPHVKPIVSVAVEHLDASAASVAASVIEGIANVLGVDVKNLLESAAPPPNDNPQLAQSIATVIDLVETTAIPAGFTTCEPEIDADNRIIRLTLNHPVDPAPVLQPVQLGDGGFFQPSIGLDRGQVHAGERVTVSGSNFPANQATRAGVQWNDTTTGVVNRSELDVSINDAAAERVTVPRTRLDNNNVFFKSPIAPNSKVTFSVRDCDQFTCTPFSNDVVVTSTLVETVDLSLESNGVSVSLPGNATVDANGAFSVQVVIPLGTSPGSHRLTASVDAAEAGASLTVLPDTQPVPLQLHQVDPNTGQVVSTEISLNQRVGVRGDGFPSGRPIIIQLDGQVFRPSVADATTDSGGSFTTVFTWPADSAGGTHQIFASVSDSFPEISTSLNVFVMLPPR